MGVVKEPEVVVDVEVGLEDRSIGSSPWHGLNHLRVMNRDVGYAIVVVGDVKMMTTAMFISRDINKHRRGPPVNHHR